LPPEKVIVVGTARIGRQQADAGALNWSRRGCHANINDHDMIQAVAPQRPDQPLNIWVLLGTKLGLRHVGNPVPEGG
jgi:hypothetical protein